LKRKENKFGRLVFEPLNLSWIWLLVNGTLEEIGSVES